MLCDCSEVQDAKVSSCDAGGILQRRLCKSLRENRLRPGSWHLAEAGGVYRRSLSSGMRLCLKGFRRVRQATAGERPWRRLRGEMRRVLPIQAPSSSRYRAICLSARQGITEGGARKAPGCSEVQRFGEASGLGAAPASGFSSGCEAAGAEAGCAAAGG
jgi:hypothetical protein